MFTNRTAMSGRHFLQIPGPTNVPDSILRAINAPTIDHRGPEFAALTLDILDKLPRVFQTQGPVIIFPASGTGAWEAALLNCLSPAYKILMCETGHFEKDGVVLQTKFNLTQKLFPRTGDRGLIRMQLKPASKKMAIILLKRSVLCITKHQPAWFQISKRSEQ